MGTGLAGYFAENRPKFTYSLGDRVFIHYHKILCAGYVGNDSMVNEEDGRLISVHLDLPLKYNDTWINYVFVKPHAVIRMVDFDDDMKMEKHDGRRKKRTEV